MATGKDYLDKMRTQHVPEIDEEAIRDRQARTMRHLQQSLAAAASPGKPDAVKPPRSGLSASASLPRSSSRSAARSRAPAKPRPRINNPAANAFKSRPVISGDADSVDAAGAAGAVAGGVIGARVSRVKKGAKVLGDEDFALLSRARARNRRRTALRFRVESPKLGVVKNNTSMKFQIFGLIAFMVTIVVGNMMFDAHRIPRENVSVEWVAPSAAVPEPLSEVRFDSGVYFGMTHIDQRLEGMPNGCGIVSLAMVLSRDSAGISPRDINERFLDKRMFAHTEDGARIGYDPAYYYKGDPTLEWGGFGVFAPGLSNAANRAIEESGIARTAYDISGISEGELLEHVRQNPVIVWVTRGLEPVSWDYYPTWRLPDGRPVHYPHNQHSVVLVAYTDTSVTVYDPASGVVDYDRGLFLQRWGEVGPWREQTRQAVVLIADGTGGDSASEADGGAEAEREERELSEPPPEPILGEYGNGI